MKWLAGVLAVLVTIPLLVLLFFSPANACGPSALIPRVAEGQTVGRWDAEQLTNAAAIIQAAGDLELNAHAAVIGVMTAMGESSLRNIDYGDNAINPDGGVADSIGLFQQQGSWGTVAERMDPATSARLFFDRLAVLDGWAGMVPTLAANAVQRNSDPYHYDPYHAEAVEVVEALTGATLDLVPGASGACAAAGDGSFSPATGAAPGPWGGFSNGKIPESALQPLPWNPDRTLRADAAQALIALNNAFRAEFGYDLPLNDAYRSYESQVRAREFWCSLGSCRNAAEPGTSNHGWGMAIDVANRQSFTISEGSPIFVWLTANAGRYGWVHPDWAKPGGTGPREAWHWEYYGLAVAA